MQQQSLKSGVLVKWTKSFNCSGVEGNDVVKLLTEALERKGCSDVTVWAVLNDTTGTFPLRLTVGSGIPMTISVSGTFLMGAYMDRETSIGLILGTGCNACYLEKSEKVQEWERKRYGEEVWKFP